MNKIVQHIPGFIGGDGAPEGVRFDSVAELLEIPWIKQWEKTFIPPTEWAEAMQFHEFDLEIFYRWAMCDNSLMAEYNEGKRWYVIGCIEKPEEVDLPRVVEEEYGRRMKDRRG